MTKNKRLAMAILKTTFFPIIILSLISGYLLLPLYDSVIPKNYNAKSRFMVEEKKELTKQYGGDQSSKYLSNYNVLIFSDKILEPVQKKFGGKRKLALNDIKSSLNVIYSNDSQIITIEVITEDEDKSIKLANLLLDEVLTEIPKIITTNNLKEINKAIRADEHAKLSKTTYLGATIIFFMCFYSLIVVYIFIIKQKIYFKSQVKSLLGNRNVYEV